MYKRSGTVRRAARPLRSSFAISVRPFVRRVQVKGVDQKVARIVSLKARHKWADRYGGPQRWRVIEEVRAENGAAMKEPPFHLVGGGGGRSAPGTREIAEWMRRKCPEPHPGAWCAVAKNRSGARAWCALRFNGTCFDVDREVREEKDGAPDDDERAAPEEE